MGTKTPKDLNVNYRTASMSLSEEDNIPESGKEIYGSITGFQLISATKEEVKCWVQNEVIEAHSIHTLSQFVSWYVPNLESLHSDLLLCNTFLVVAYAFYVLFPSI